MTIVETRKTENRGPKTQVLAAGGLAAGLLASSCCLLPLLLVSLGIGGAWMAQLTALSPYQPIFLGAAVIALGLGLRRAYRRQDCADGSLCESPRTTLVTKVLLWLGVAVVLAVISINLVVPMIT